MIKYQQLLQILSTEKGFITSGSCVMHKFADNLEVRYFSFSFYLSSSKPCIIHYPFIMLVSYHCNGHTLLTFISKYEDITVQIR